MSGWHDALLHIIGISTSTIKEFTSKYIKNFVISITSINMRRKKKDAGIKD
jgi:hypothetical protein